MRNIFITGTSTDVGKTFISTLLCLKYGFDYWKPYQTGINAQNPQSDSDFVSSFGVKTHPELMILDKPLSPYAALDPDKRAGSISDIKLPKTHNGLIIEGAGGVMVPIYENITMIDLIKHLDIPVIVVASDVLGTINHTLLTIEALKARNINIIGFVMNFKQNASENEDIICKFSKTKCLFSVSDILKCNLKEFAEELNVNF